MKSFLWKYCNVCLEVFSVDHLQKIFLLKTSQREIAVIPFYIFHLYDNPKFWRGFILRARLQNLMINTFSTTRTISCFISTNTTEFITWIIIFIEFAVSYSTLHILTLMVYLTVICMKYLFNVTAWNGSPETHKRKYSIN